MFVINDESEEEKGKEVIKKKLIIVMEYTNNITQEQFGFRQSHNTTQQIERIATFVK